MCVLLQARHGRDGHDRLALDDQLTPAPDSRGVPRSRHATDPAHRPAAQACQAELKPPGGWMYIATRLVSDSAFVNLAETTFSCSLCSPDARF